MSKWRWEIEILTVGKAAQPVKVFDPDTGLRRNAYFSTEANAQEAARIISMLRTDSAFKGTQIIKADQ